MFPFPAPPGSSLPIAPPTKIYIFPLITNKQQIRKERVQANHWLPEHHAQSSEFSLTKSSVRVDSFTPSAQHSPSFPSVAKAPKPNEHTTILFCYIRTHINTQVQTHMCTEGHKHTQTYVLTCCHTHTQSVQRYTHVCIHANNAYIQVLHMVTHTCMHTHEHTHIQSCTFAHVHTCAYSEQFTSLYILARDALIS